MKMGGTDSAGLVLPEITPSSFAGLPQHITDAARQHQLSVNVATSNGDVEVEPEHAAEPARRRVSGVILLSAEPFQDSSWAAAVGVPVLVLGRPFTVEESAAAASHLAERGRRRIARVSGAPQYCFIQQRELGVARALVERGIDGEDRRR